MTAPVSSATAMSTIASEHTMTRFGTGPVMRQIGSTIDWNMPSIPRISVG